MNESLNSDSAIPEITEWDQLATEPETTFKPETSPDAEPDQLDSGAILEQTIADLADTDNPDLDLQKKQEILAEFDNIKHILQKKNDYSTQATIRAFKRQLAAYGVARLYAERHPDASEQTSADYQQRIDNTEAAVDLYFDALIDFVNDVAAVEHEQDRAQEQKQEQEQAQTQEQDAPASEAPPTELSAPETPAKAS